jgi:hypothetical protein
MTAICRARRVTLALSLWFFCSDAIVLAALIWSGNRAHADDIYITQTDPFLVRMPHTRADFDEMFAVITEAEPGEKRWAE